MTTSHYISTKILQIVWRSPHIRKMETIRKGTRRTRTIKKGREEGRW
jgi:hypothetical protein